MTERVIAVLSLALLLLAGCSANPDGAGDFLDVPGIGATRVDVPRPTTEGAPECTPSMVADESIPERASALRKIGLFADRSMLSDQDLGDAIETEIKGTWGDQISATDPLMDLLVAERDPARVWWHDLEADVVDENQVYVATLEEWAAISEGTFNLSNIVETWASDDGPVTVTFTLDGQTHEVQPEVIDDWIDPRIAQTINELIASSGRRFEFVQAFDQTGFVMALTRDERSALEARGWCFE